ncbi:TIGR03619 family F420-dependent LLM class oxidoreductase [Actinomadura scrupuli]|uniref:TIGR03619 family F420-dependent LLM class oxidoreductase n=1 Tax=Actinomadura scrupuli TaxID=559629 RepID=UPI003D95C1D9
MKIGFAVPDTGSWALPAHQLQIAGRAEELGYHSLWTLQRLVNPADSADETYRNVPDPLITLAYLAGRTSRIRLGVAIVNLPFVSPPLLAKQATTLDHVSGGRLDLGLGLGWMPEEFAAVGVPYERRGARAEEFLGALRALWTQPVTEFHGEFYDIPPVVMDPKPLQSPHPPLLLGGTSEPALRRAGRLADGWISSSRADLGAIGESITLIKNVAAEAGRDPEALRFICRGVVRVRGESGTPAAPAGEQRPLTGSYAKIRDDLGALGEQGVTETFLDLNFDPEVGGPHADPEVSMRRAEDALVAFAPSA